MHRIALACAALLLAAAPAAQGHQQGLLDVAPRMAAGEACPGPAGFAPQIVRTGAFGRELMGGYVMVPFAVPAGTTQVKVRYCHDQPESAQIPQTPRHTLDLGLWDARGFRGWGGSSHPEVQVTPQGFMDEALYEASPRSNVPGRTTRGFRPGPLPAGTWEAELGVASVASEGDRDGKVAWRLEVELSSDPAFATEPYAPARYDEAPARRGPGWYTGDLHVHAEHSALGDATMRETFAYAFGPAKLDFVMLSDYVTDSGWAEIGRRQADHPGRLVARSTEVITYSGHVGNHVSGRYVDHRAGAVHVLREDGTTGLRRPARSVNELLGDVRAGGGITQANHPTIFPSAVPGFASLCRGCPWDFRDTDWRLVDLVEVHTGPPGVAGLGNNPFTTTAIDFYERALSGGARVAAVGVSDSHNAGRTNGPTQSPVGTGATAVYADELSEAGLRRALRAGHTYAKVFGAASPDVRLEATVPGAGAPPAIMGDTVRASAATLTATVIGGDGMRLEWWRDGAPVAGALVSGARATSTYRAPRPGRYRLQLSQGGSVHVVTTPVWLDPSAPAPPGAADERLPASVRALIGSRATLRRAVRCRAKGLGLRSCTLRARVRGRTIARGSAPLRGGEARVRLRLTREGRRLVARRARFRATLEARATGTRGSVGPVAKRLTVVRR
jgi:hypothetical protein